MPANNRGRAGLLTVEQLFRILDALRMWEDGDEKHPDHLGTRSH